MAEKIGILTFHYAHNYGAVLQAYALKTVLNSCGYDACIIDYKNENIVLHYPPKISFPIRKKEIFFPINWRKLIKKILARKRALSLWEAQYKKFETFIDGYISPVKYEQEKFMALICGSDQVWGGKTGPTQKLDEHYFLKAYKNVIKIAYAVSHPTGIINENEKTFYNEALNDYSLITAREKIFAESITATTGISCFEAVDPVFLVKSELYEEIASESDVSESGYILTYYIDDNDELKKCAKYLSSRTGNKIIELRYFFDFNSRSSNQIADAGPADFLKLIINSAFVLTNSFHGTAMAIIMHKNFYAVYDKDSRKDNLLDKLGLFSRHIRNCKEIKNVDFKEDIDFSSVDVHISENAERSIGMLLECLKDAKYKKI